MTILEELEEIDPDMPIGEMLAVIRKNRERLLAAIAAGVDTNGARALMTVGEELERKIQDILETLS